MIDTPAEAAKLNRRLVDSWSMAATDLGIRVTAPAELRDAMGRPFACEALIHDFGSADGAVIVSQRTKRRVRENLRSLVGSFVCIEPDGQPSDYQRKRHIECLNDLGWFGASSAPSWYGERP